MRHLFIVRQFSLILIGIVISAGLVYAAAAKRHDLGKHVIAGVQLHTVLIDVANPAYVAMGMGKTHHLEARFRSVSRKKLLTKGLVGIKVIKPNGDVLPAQQMVLDNGVYTFDFSFIEPGTYRLWIACRLYDGRKRQYEVKYTVR